MIRFEGGKTTRQGSLIFLDDVLSEAIGRAREIVPRRTPACLTRKK